MKFSKKYLTYTAKYYPLFNLFSSYEVQRFKLHDLQLDCQLGLW